MSGLFEELPRRKAYRVAVAYIVVAGFLIQIASAAFPAWDLPNSSQRLPVTPALLRLDPMFDPLQDDSGLEKLAGSPAPK